MAQDFLNLKQINTCLNQMGCITVTQAVRCNFFLIPQAKTTFLSVV